MRLLCFTDNWRRERECHFFLVHDLSPKMIYHQMYNNSNTRRDTVCSTRVHHTDLFLGFVFLNCWLPLTCAPLSVLLSKAPPPHPHPHWSLSVFLFFVVRLLTTPLLFPNNANHWFYTEISVINRFSDHYFLPHINRHM